LTLEADRLRTIIRAEAYRTVPITDAHGTKAVSMAQAVVRSLAVNAAKGNQRAQRLFTELLSNAEREDRREREALLDVAIAYKLAMEQELERRKARGITAPEPLPHPDDIHIDLHTGTVHIRGPATKQEKVAWAEWEKHCAMFEEELTELEMLRDDPDCPNPREVRMEIKKTEDVLMIIRIALAGSRAAMHLLEGIQLPEDGEPPRKSRRPTRS
jgi:hypothetical protein